MSEFTGWKINALPSPNWRLRLAGDSFSLCIYLSKSPNRFQRWMHKVCFGIIWEPMR